MSALYPSFLVKESTKKWTTPYRLYVKSCRRAPKTYDIPPFLGKSHPRTWLWVPSGTPSSPKIFSQKENEDIRTPCGDGALSSPDNTVEGEGRAPTSGEGRDEDTEKWARFLANEILAEFRPTVEEVNGVMKALSYYLGGPVPHGRSKFSDFLGAGLDYAKGELGFDG